MTDDHRFLPAGHLLNYGDERQTFWCALCGGRTETRDHAPSRVFLEPPYPAQLPVVRTCASCNQGASLDEEYVACLVECAAVASIDGPRLRPRIRRKLQEKPSLRERIRKSMVGEQAFAVEHDRVSRVIVKLARGHALFELNEPRWEEPDRVQFATLQTLTSDARRIFEELPVSDIWPEVGSRAMQRIVDDQPGASAWINVQTGLYRYLASVAGGTLVRLVIREYLACEIAWS